LPAKKTPAKNPDKTTFGIAPENGRAATASANTDVQLVRVGEVLSSLWLPPDLPREEQKRRLDAAMEALKDIAPKDGQEGMLAAQRPSLSG
jgi:hypothetical protein